jgi:hypothetical protein
MGGHVARMREEIISENYKILFVKREEIIKFSNLNKYSKILIQIILKKFCMRV